ncbi:MAG: hypothetical protein M5R41_08910 [Bacteroidia bacterium]|nr:hypothetical protein [Bacteroidia bacterium]
MLKMFIACACLAMVFLLQGCSDDPEGTPTDRFVYYADASGLHRYSIGSETDEILAQENVVSLTQVAENGIVLYGTESGGVRRLWGRCENGTLIPVPLPVAESANEEYILAGTPASLSWKGHHAAFIAYRRPSGSIDSTVWNATLCWFNCGEWKMTLGDITAFLRTRFAALDLTLLTVRVHAVHVTDYGDAVAVLTQVRARRPDGSEINTSALLGFDAAGFRVLDPIQTGEGEILSHIKFDQRSSVIYAFPSWKPPFAVDLRTGDTRDLVTPAIPYDPWTPVSQETAEFVETCLPDFVLRRIDTGARTTVLTAVGVSVAAHTDLMPGAAHAPALSPDGQWAAMLWPSTDGQEVLFLVGRGGDIRRVTKGSLKYSVSVSAVVPE